MAGFRMCCRQSLNPVQPNTGPRSKHWAECVPEIKNGCSNYRVVAKIRGGRIRVFPFRHFPFCHFSFRVSVFLWVGLGLGVRIRVR